MGIMHELHRKGIEAGQRVTVGQAGSFVF